MDVPLRWVAALDADVNTDYLIEYDLALSGSFATVATRDSTNRGDGSYTPYSTTLNGDIAAGATSLVMTSATNFANGEYAVLEQEMFLLGGKSSNTFAAVVGGQGTTRKRPHLSGVAIYKAHESYTHAGVTFGQRKCVTYRIHRVQGSDQSLAEEILAIQPTLPATRNLSACWVVVQDAQGNRQTNVEMQMTLTEAALYDAATSEFFYKDTEVVVTDDDGYAQFFLPRYLSTVPSIIATVKIAPNTAAETNWDIVRLPTTNTVHLLDLI